MANKHITITKWNMFTDYGLNVLRSKWVRPLKVVKTEPTSCGTYSYRPSQQTVNGEGDILVMDVSTLSDSNVGKKEQKMLPLIKK